MEGEVDTVWKYFLQHVVQDIFDFQIQKDVSNDKAAFEKLLIDLIPSLQISKVCSAFICVIQQQHLVANNFQQVLSLLRTDRSIMHNMTHVPVISILLGQMTNVLKEWGARESLDPGLISKHESLLARLPAVYKDSIKRGLQTFVSPSHDLNTIPTRKASGSVYARCLQIYKSALDPEVIDLLDKDY